MHLPLHLARRAPRLAALAALVALAAPCRAQTDDAPETNRDKRAQTGMKFLSVSGDARAAALGSATTALEGGAAMLFENPAGMAWMEGTTDLMLGQTQWITGIDYNHAAAAFRPAGGRFGVIGVSLVSTDYGEMTETVFAENDQGYEELGTFSPAAFSVGLGYARVLSDRFSVGGQVKYANQDLGSSAVTNEGGSYTRQENEKGTLAYDFGVHYKTGYESLTFAVAARNFAPELAYVEESFQLPLTFQIGVAMDLVDLTALDPNVHRLQLSVNANNPRDFSEQIKVGGEYTVFNTLSLRGGYVFPSDSESFHLGAGVQQSLGGFGLGADYAYSDLGVFSGVHRVAVRLSL